MSFFMKVDYNIAEPYQEYLIIWSMKTFIKGEEGIIPGSLDCCPA